MINEIQKHVSDQSNSVVNDMKHTYYESVNTHTTNSVICPGDRVLCQNHRANVKTGKVLIRKVVRSPKMKRDPTNMEG